MAPTKITSNVIADDAIDSEHYTDGSIDTAHLADDAVTSAKLDTNLTIAGTLGVTGALTMGANAEIKSSSGYTIYSSTGSTYIDSVSGNSDILFRPGASQAVIMKGESGKVGIGTTAPSQKLHVFQTEGDAGAKHAAIQFSGYAAQPDRGPMIAAYRVDGNSNNQGLIFSTYDATNAVVDTLTMTNAGRVGINDTSPSYTLDVDGDINFTGTLREDGTEFSGGISMGKAIAAAIVFG